MLKMNIGRSSKSGKNAPVVKAQDPAMKDTAPEEAWRDRAERLDITAPCPSCRRQFAFSEGRRAAARRKLNGIICPKCGIHVVPFLDGEGHYGMVEWRKEDCE